MSPTSAASTTGRPWRRSAALALLAVAPDQPIPALPGPAPPRPHLRGAPAVCGARHVRRAPPRPRPRSRPRPCPPCPSRAPLPWHGGHVVVIKSRSRHPASGTERSINEVCLTLRRAPPRHAAECGI
ncbi:hypothetical protein FOCC_FOCC005292 [Frankliniella occidentalis]|nr:hypothetical protein FOCC_FOCC005292 [Frankliniella occidentalis]